MKNCSLCKENLPLENFAFKNKTLNKRNAMCNECRHERQKLSYYKHHEKNLERIKRNKKQNNEWYLQMKQTMSCCICGENEPSCLDFHHVDSSSKDFNLSEMRLLSKRKIVEELNKCSCLCANCHRKYHAGKLFTPLVKLNITQSYEV